MGFSAEIHVSRVSPSGRPLDGGGIVVATAANPWGGGGPAVSFDGTNFLVAWADIRSGFTVRLRCRRRDLDGGDPLDELP